MNEKEYEEYLKDTFNEDYFRGKPQGFPDFSDIPKHWRIHSNRFTRFLRFGRICEIIGWDFFVNSRILVVGAGWGYEMIFLDSLGFTEVYGIEPSEFAVKNFMKWAPHHLRCNMLCLPAHLLNLKDEENPFAVVFCHDTLEHIPLEMLDVSLEGIRRVASKIVVFTITTTIDEDNIDADPTHVIKESPDWWLEKLREYFGYVDVTTFSIPILPEQQNPAIWSIFYCRVDFDES